MCEYYKTTDDIFTLTLRYLNPMNPSLFFVLSLTVSVSFVSFLLNAIVVGVTVAVIAIVCGRDNTVICNDPISVCVALPPSV